MVHAHKCMVSLSLHSTLQNRLAKGCAQNIYRQWHLFLFAKLRFNFQKRCNHKCYNTCHHHDIKENLIANSVFYISRHHAWQHQAEIRDARTYSIVRCLVFSLTIIKHIERQCGKSEAIAQLLGEEACRDECQVVGLCIAEVYIHDVGQRDSPYHGP